MFFGKPSQINSFVLYFEIKGTTIKKCLLQKDVIIIVAVILLPIAALIGLTISQVVKSSAIRDDALQAQKDIENFLRVQELVRRIQVTEMFL